MKTVPLLATKLYVPAPQPNLVTRPRLIERLSEGLRLGHKLTLISAPAGFGKTTLASAWAASCGRSVAWLSLDEGDNDPARFLAYLAAAMRTVGVEVGEGEFADAGVPAATESLLTVLVNRFDAIAEPLILVLDDYHFITAQVIHDALAFLLDHQPGDLHLVIVSRADPPLPVARLRARGQLTELRQADLCFAPAEAAEFLNRVMGLELSAEDVAALASRTEGWIAGLQMAAVSMQGRDDAAGFVRSFTGSDRYVLDYLVEEVLQRQPPHIQAFLLQTSILDRLCAPLCDAVRVSEPTSQRENMPIRSFADSQLILEHLDRFNLFIVPLDDRREWYRYHRLFADLLQARLHQQMRTPGVAPLHRRASAWFEQNGLMAEAIDHALAAEDLDRAADLIEQNAETTLMHGEVATFMRWTGALPDDLVRARPTLCVLYAWMLLWQSQSLKVIESLLQGVEEEGERVSGRVTALRGLMAGLRGQTGLAIELSRRALEQLPEEEQFIRMFATWILRTAQLVSGEGVVDDHALDEVFRMSQGAGNVMLSVMITCNRAELLMRQGQLHEAAAVYRRAVDLATDAQGRRLPIAGQALIGLGELSREWGDLDAAERYLLEGIELTEQWTEVGPLDAYISLARVRRAQGDMDGAWKALRQAQELAVKFDLTDLDDLSVAMVRAWMWVSQGDLEAARRWAEERDLFRYITVPLQEEASDSYDLRIRKYELLVLARLLIAQERPGEALKLLGSLVPVAEWRGRPGMLVEIHALQALAYQAQGNLDRAMDALEHALSLAEPKGYVSVFAGAGEPMKSLIADFRLRIPERTCYLGEEKTRHLRLYTDRLLAAFPDFGLGVSDRGLGESDKSAIRDLQSTIAEPLSERELEVLRLLAAGMSSTEMAEQLVVSVNTVRTHVKSIYAKLRVHRRLEAVRRAEELGLV
jgi:LuxR family maltose regulon positive regulatory protein